MVRPHRQMRDDRENSEAKSAAEKGSETERVDPRQRNWQEW